MKRYLRILVIILFIGLAGLAAYRWKVSTVPTPPATKSSEAGSLAAIPTNDPAIQHIFIILEENKPYPNVIGSSSAPYINGLIEKNSLATNYFGVAHPSLPNYIALTSGTTAGFTGDCNPPSAGCEVNVKNIADEIEHSNRTWKEYAESMPSACYMFNAGNYATKHNPFVYYEDIVNNQSRCKSHVVPFSQMAGDLKNITTTPDYAFITPNLCNDMHDCSVATGDQWLARNVPLILNSAAFKTQKSLLVITWDEGDSSDNHIPAIFMGSAAKQGYDSGRAYNHYSLLRTIEWAWNLNPLTNNDKSVAPMTDMLSQSR